MIPEALPSDKGKEEERLGESREQNCRGSVYYKAARTDEDISIKTKRSLQKHLVQRLGE